MPVLPCVASGRRASGVMAAAAARLDPAAMRALAEHYAALPGLRRQTNGRLAASRTADDPVALRVVTHGLPEANLPACANCHAPGRRPDYPVLAGQKPEYLAARLRRWRGDEHVVDARKPNAPMPVIARRIPEDLIERLAQYYARQ